METTSRNNTKHSASTWLFGLVTLAVLLAICTLSYRIYEVFADPLTQGRRWIIIDRDYTLLLTLLPIAFLLAVTARLKYLRAQIQSAKFPASWNAIDAAMSLEEEREGKLLLRFPALGSYMIKAFEAPCLKDGVFVKALVFARHNEVVLFSHIENPLFFVGEIDAAGKLSGSLHFSNVAQAVEVFLNRIAGST